MTSSGEEAEMAKLMGFTGFSTGSKLKKRKLNASEDTTPVDGIQYEIRDKSNPNLIEITEPRTQGKGLAKKVTTERDEPAEAAQSRDSGHVTSEANAQWTSSEDTIFNKSLGELTSQDLNRLRFGLKRADGLTVYFMPSFIEDPWA
jgi:hypothetical protein